MTTPSEPSEIEKADIAHREARDKARAIFDADSASIREKFRLSVSKTLQEYKTLGAEITLAYTDAILNANEQLKADMLPITEEFKKRLASADEALSRRLRW